MKPELFPEEIDIPCHNGPPEHPVQTKRFPNTPVPSVYAHSSISMRYDTYKPGRVAVIDPCSATLSNSHRPGSIFEEESVADKRTAPPKVALRTKMNQRVDDARDTDTKQSRRSSLVSSRNNPLPLAQARSSNSIRFCPSRPNVVHVVDPSSPTYTNEVSPISDHVGSISSVVSIKGYAVGLDDGSIKAFPKRRMTMRSKRRHPPLTFQNSLTSVQTAPSVIQRVTVDFLDKVGETHSQKHLNGFTTKRDRTSAKQYIRRGDEKLPKSNSCPSTRPQSTYTQRNNNKSDAVEFRHSQYPHRNECFSRTTSPFRQQWICPVDFVESSRRVAKQAIETRDDESFSEYNIVYQRQLQSLSDQSLRGMSTIASDFEVEVCAHGETDEGNDDCDDDCSMATFNSIATTMLNGSKANGMLGRLVPKKIKEKLLQHRSGARSVFSAPERGLPFISEMTTVDHKHNARMSTGPTITVNSKVIENVTSELTDMNFSEDQSTTSIPNEKALKQSPNIIETARRKTAIRVARKVDGKATVATDDQKSVSSNNSTKDNYREVGQMLSPVTSDLSRTMSESFKSRRVRIPDRDREVNSVASKASLFSRSKQKIRKSLTARQSTNFVSSQVCRKGCSSTCSANRPPRKMSTDRTATKEGEITTIYDRNAPMRYPLSTSVKADVPDENSFASELQPYPSGNENLEMRECTEKNGLSARLGDFSSPRLPSLRPAKALFGLSFGGEDANSFSGLDRHRSESKNAELSMLPSEDSGVVEEAFPDPSPEYLKSTLDDTAMNPFIASLNSLCAQYCITKT